MVVRAVNDASDALYSFIQPTPTMCAKALRVWLTAQSASTAAPVFQVPVTASPSAMPAIAPSPGGMAVGPVGAASLVPTAGGLSSVGLLALAPPPFVPFPTAACGGVSVGALGLWF